MIGGSELGDDDADEGEADTSEPLAVEDAGGGFSPYKARSLLHSLPGWKCVGRSPNRIVPPSVLRSISGMKMTTGSVVRSSSSMDAAFGMPHTFLANSITAICMPRQMPRYGVLFIRAHRAAAIMPSVPRWPNPPGTRMPCAVHTSCQALW